MKNIDHKQAKSVDDYDAQTDIAASLFHRHARTRGERKINQALLDSGISSDIIQSENSNDKDFVAKLHEVVRRKVRRISRSVDVFEAEISKSVSYIRRNCPQYNSEQRVPVHIINQALLDSGISSDIIQSKNSNVKALVEQLHGVVKRKVCESISPPGVSVCDYETETSNAASFIHCNNPDCTSGQIQDIEIDQALVVSGISVDIFQSVNPVDRNLVNDLHNIVKQKMKKTTEGKILEARQYANRMAHTDKKGVFQANVCIVCDRHIIGTEKICHLTKTQLRRNTHRIGVDSYNDYYTKEGYSELLPESELVKQYTVDGMEGLLLSRRSRHTIENEIDRYESCKSCYDNITKSYMNINPPKFAIANGFVIGHVPRVLKFLNEDGTTREVVLEYLDKDGIKRNKVNDIVRAMVAPTRAYGYTFSYFAGAQRSIQGHYVFYEVDQSLVGSSFKQIEASGANPHVHIVLGGRFTPSQKRIIHDKTVVDTKLVTDLMKSFKENGHEGFRQFTPPEKCPAPRIDQEVEEDFEIDKETEERFDGGIYHFSSANAPSQDTGSFGTQLRFTKSLLKRTPPTLLAYGGEYTSGRSLRLENAIPTAFPWGLGGPQMKRRITVGEELALAHYCRLSLDQFMKGDFCLLANHMLDRRLSYTSGKVKCRATIDGVSLAEKVSQLTVKDLEDVVSGANTNSVASQLLTSVSASCKAMGHTPEAAAHWRRVFFALSDRHGMNAFMLTVTPNDLVNFSVRVIALAGEPHKMPSLDSTEKDCIADIKLRRETRLDFPGACSLNFQSVMQIVLEVLLGWDSKSQSGSDNGIVGELDAWGMAVEEQARKTLHSHWLLWSKRLANVRDKIFDVDGNMRESAKADFCERVDKVMSASYTDNEWTVEHECGTKGKVGGMFKECNLQVLRDSRHKDLCHDIKGKVMECKECHEKVSTQDIINLALNEWYINAKKDENLTFPLSKERHDIAVYRTSYDMMSGCYEADKFWGDKDVRKVLQISGENEHHSLHGPRCFKKGKECTSGSFPQASCTSIDISIDEGAPVLEWYLLNGKIKRTAPWLLLPKRPLGCQYLNTHNIPISTIFNCNSNVIIGDASNTFYLTLYGSKSTQSEDKEKKERILKKLIRRLKRLQMERERNHPVQSDFGLGLSMTLSAINASTSRDVVSTTMAHYLVSLGGERFSSSHKPKHLLILQMEETLDGKAVNFALRRTNKSKEDGTIVQWPDSTAHDYLYRSEELDKVCSYNFTELYKRDFFNLKDVDKKRQDDIIKNSTEIKRYRFTEAHPGHEFAYIERLKLPAVAVVSLPRGKLPLLRDLEIDNDKPSDHAIQKRESYAKIALLMFYHFRELEDLKTDDSYWTTFDNERDLYFKGKETEFWKTGFEILQNIEDREMMMRDDHRVRARDPVQMETTLREDDTAKKKTSQEDKIPDISQFYDEDDVNFDESDIENEAYENGVRWTHNTLIERAQIANDSIISARIASNESIFHSSALNEDEHESDMREGSTGEEYLDRFRNICYPTFIQLISGTLVGVTDYDEIFEDDLMDVTLSDNRDEVSDEDVHVITQEERTSSQEDRGCNIPTLVGVARKVARQDKVKLDEKQYIAYEIIACTFLLKLVEEGRDRSSFLGQYLGSALNTSNEDTDQLVKHLKARGGMEQLLMFLTGPAGAGKSTAVKVAERFCLEFCAAVSVMWYDETFLFTACSGSAAAIFGGITIHSAAVLNGKVTDKARKTWQKVDIVMIDEISYFSDNDFKKLDRKLKDLNGVPNKPFGGQSIIFSGDFRQFEAILAKHLLYHRNGSQLWENSINCVIILENIHRFKDDPEYGEMLTRLWRDDLTQADREKINTRVVGGQDGVTLPVTFDKDVVYACSTNKERNGIQAGIFRNHILDTHPTVGSLESPPDHTIMIEAVIESSKSKQSSIPIGNFTRDRIIHTCGDADCKVNETKYIDPALRLYVGAHCMCTVDNKRLKDKVPIGNGTLCRVVGIKLNDHAPSHRWQNWDGRKVSTVSAKHVDWVEFEYHPKSKSILQLENEIKELEWELKINQEAYEITNKGRRKRAKTMASTSRRMTRDPIIQDIISGLNKKKAHLTKEQQSRRFKLEPKPSSPTVSFTEHELSTYTTTAKCRMIQIPVILADSITGHKLQGMTIPHVIIASWGYFAKNWPYVVLSRCTTFKGLYLFKPIDMEKSFAPSRDLIEYLRRAEDLQDHILHMRKVRMAEILANDENDGIVL